MPSKPNPRYQTGGNATSKKWGAGADPGSLYAKAMRNPKMKEAFRVWEKQWRDDLGYKCRQLKRDCG